jgi:hypothetical protein
MKQTLNLKNAQLEPLSEIEMMQIDGGSGNLHPLGVREVMIIGNAIVDGAKAAWNWWSSLERKGTS